MATDSALKRLRTAGGVIDALGGTTAVAKLTGRYVQQISNARGANRLPPQTFLIMTKALAEIRASAPAHIWGIDVDARSLRGRSRG